MRLFLKNIEDLDFKCDTLILPLIEGDGMSPYEDVDRVLSGLPSGVISSGKFHAKSNKTLLLQTCEKIPSKSILLIGLGRKEKISGDTLRQAGGTAASCLSDSGQAEIALSTRSISHLGLKPTDFIEGSLLSHYCFNRYKGEKDFKRTRKLTVLSADKLKTRIRKIEVIAAATHFARDLVNTPSNDMTPSALVKAARTLRNISVKVIDKKEAERLHMGAFLSVAKGSREPPKFIVLTYKGSGGHPVVLIGKAITFDSGGLSLKPGEGMDKMKYDMAGGAAVLGAMKAVSEMKLPVHLVGVLPATENMPGGASSKPGDVVRAIDGRTIEIINTDAEGRLVLADAIGYVKKIRPSAIIDIATLTGACSVALGNEAIAMMGNDESLMKKMKAASEDTSERVWPMPLYDEYREYLKSDVADLRNISSSTGSLVTSAFFLKEFAGDTPWLHLDIAGTAWTEKAKPYSPKGATGVGVRLLTALMHNIDKD